ncbi:hypothetical protein [Desulfovibrio sp. TomC]|uniref:hypothetical protein n=1 Tax=Desulfovibrio sp. TomC TaxID=1562888 RepID=UPI0005750582|nr:hypothetical protein [Desulfovibrio sp. TomC]KHK04349.1 putative DNA-binding protein [Desulfovibrio sp. TomC]
MGQAGASRIIKRLGQALSAQGANAAARRLAGAQPLLQFHDGDAIRSLVLRHCREYSLDPAWVLLGRGSPPTSPPELTPVFAMSRIHPVTGRWQITEIERIALAPGILASGRFVTRMEGTALEPRIHHGAYLVVDTREVRVPETHETQAFFAVALRGEGLVVRLAHWDSEAGRVVLSELRPRSLPLFAPRDGVVGQVVWVAQTM